ncbi:ras and EF-hand domain-containing protein homolog isoform X1 [Styela clava]
MDQDKIEQLFEACDSDGLGYLTFNQFEQLGEGMSLPPDDVKEIFNAMDLNNDGLVEHSEFVNSFTSLTGLSMHGTPPNVEKQAPELIITDGIPDSPILGQGYNENNNNNTKDENEEKDNHKLDTSFGHRRRASTPRTNGLRSRSWHASRSKMRRSGSVDLGVIDGDKEYTANSGTWDTFAQSLGEVVYALSSYEGMSQLYKNVESSGNSELLRNYETLLQGIVREMVKVQKDMSELEVSFDKANKQSSEQISLLEEEMETQILLKENKVREEERKRADEESNKMKSQYEQQIDQLQNAITKLKQMDEKLASGSPFERELENMREKVRKLNQENSELKAKLTETETNLILLQNSMREMEVTHQEKTLEFARDEDEVSRVHEEKERYSKQVETLYSSNRQLLDSNDSLREALESSFSKYKRVSAQHARLHNGAIPMEYLNSHDYQRSGRSSRASVLDNDALAECDPGRKTPEVNGFTNHEFDSGVGTIRDDFDDSDTDYGDDSFRRGSRLSNSLRSRPRRYNSNVSYMSDGSRRSRRSYHRRAKNDYQTLSDEDNDVTNGSDITDDELRDISQSSTLSSSSRGRLNRKSPRMTPTSARKVITPDVTLGHNKRMYKVVLCGDVGVGKTSFIYRVCRNEFNRLSKSTLGVDFQIKTIQLEHDKSISLQLWDTAGQERFRSISASYFRRAEGVLLLYDCTSQHSFINVRDWMETITPVIPDGSPIMICGHKVDLREERELAGRPVVSSQEGAQLAANFGVLFVETSALDGCNVNNAVAMLARHIKLDDDTVDTDSIKQLGISPEKVEGQNCCKQT